MRSTRARSPNENWPGSSGPGRGMRRQEGLRRAGRHRAPGILLRRAPRNEDEAARGLERTPDVAEGRDRIGEEHDAEAREDEIVGLGLERMRGGIAHHERGVLQSVRTRRLDQSLGNVDTQHMSGDADRMGERGRCPAGAAADVDDVLAMLRRGGRQADVANVGERALDALVGGEPAVAAGAVPVGRLLGGELVFGLHASAAALAPLGDELAARAACSSRRRRARHAPDRPARNARSG